MISLETCQILAAWILRQESDGPGHVVTFEDRLQLQGTVWRSWNFVNISRRVCAGWADAKMEGQLGGPSSLIERLPYTQLPLSLSGSWKLLYQLRTPVTFKSNMHQMSKRRIVDTPP
jgi:hypothetical protein